MIRKEEIQQAASTYVNNWYKERDMNLENYPMDAQISREDFQAGAEWADRTIIGKTCEWLKNNFRSSPYDSTKVITHFSNMIDVVIDFRKEMEA